MDKKRILIVEDEVIIGLDVSRQLSGIGFDICGLAGSGEEAVKKAEELKPDLVLMDIMLSGSMDGIEAARIISEHNPIPVVYMTGNADYQTVQRARETKPFGYILKPVTMQSLFSTIDTAIQRDVLEKRIQKQNEELAKLNEELQSRHNRLIESEERFRKLVESIDDVVVTLDKEQRHTGVFGTWLDKDNMKPEMFIGKTAGEILGEEVSAVHEAANRKALTGEHVVYEWHTGEGKNRRYYQTSLSPLIDASRNVTGIVGVARDVTETKKHEYESRRNEARLQSLLAISNMRLSSRQEMLDFALQEALALTGSGYGYLFRYDERSKTLHLDTWSKGVLARCTVANPPSEYQLEETGAWGEVVRQRKPIVINDFQRDNPLKRGYPEGHVEIRNFMSVPIFRGPNIIAVAGLANKDTDFDESDVRQLTLLMDSVWKLSGSDAMI